MLKVGSGGGGEDDEEIDITRLYRRRRGEVEREIWERFRVKINKVGAAGVIEVLGSRVERGFRF